jgi:hypothetical protein
MLAPSEAVDKARTYLGEVIPEFAALEPKVEEMVLAPDSSEWKITFYAFGGGEKKKATSLADMLRWQRIEKVVSVGAEDGALIAVRNPLPF